MNILTKSSRNYKNIKRRRKPKTLRRQKQPVFKFSCYGKELFDLTDSAFRLADIRVESKHIGDGDYDCIARCDDATGRAILSLARQSVMADEDARARIRLAIADFGPFGEILRNERKLIGQ